jgi:S-adenosyl methyltransferase
MYDYALGGKDNYLVDREASEQVRESLPTTLVAVQENRRFMRRAVRYLLSAGVRQFMDIGCGLPGRGNMHDLVYAHDPLAAVVYVDNDPVIVNHYRALLSSTGTAVVLNADVRRPEEILGSPSVTELIDFGRPVGVLMCALLHYIDDEEDPAGIVGAFGAAMAPGSHLALSHYHADGLSPDEQALTAKIAEDMGITMAQRDRAGIEGLFGELEVLDPGLVPPALWRPDRPQRDPTGWLLAGVGVKRHPVR